MRPLVRVPSTAIDLALGVAAITAAGVVIAYTAVAVGLRVWRSEPPPKGAIVGIRCHWNGPWLIARGTVVNFGDRDAGFEVQPNIAVTGHGGFPREEDSVSVRAGSVRAWRWTSDRKGEATGTPVSRCSATASGLSGGKGDD